MWTVVKNGHAIMITAHIDNFILACADRNTLDEFRCSLLERFEGAYEGEIHSYLGCEIRRENDNTLLLHRHFAKDVLQYDSAEWEPAFLRQEREFLFFPLLPREASKSVPIFDRGTGSKPERLRFGFL